MNAETAAARVLPLVRDLVGRRLTGSPAEFEVAVERALAALTPKARRDPLVVQLVIQLSTVAAGVLAASDGVDAAGLEEFASRVLSR